MPENAKYREICETVEWRMANPGAKPRHICLPTELIVRDSTGGSGRT